MGTSGDHSKLAQGTTVPPYKGDQGPAWVPTAGINNASTGLPAKRKRRPPKYVDGVRVCHDCDSEMTAGVCRPCKSRWMAAYRVANRAKLDAQKALSRYGLDYDRMLASQDGRCAACGVHHSTLKRRLQVDHDHTCCPARTSCGKCVRGLLCHKCNTTLGMVDDDPSRLRALINYIERSKVP